MDVNTSSINILNSSVSTHTNSINTLNSSVSTHTNSINALNSKVSHDILFNGNSNGTISLSASAANYNHMRIYYRTNDSVYLSVDVYSPNGKYVGLMGAWASSGNAYIKMRAVSISGTSISTYSSCNYEIQLSNSPSINVTAATNVFITRVEAWKI